jgi:ammonia channel protein AmtB
MDIEKVAVLVILVSVAWFLVGWSVGYKEGIKDGFNRGRASGLRMAVNTTKAIVRNS